MRQLLFPFMLVLILLSCESPDQDSETQIARELDSLFATIPDFSGVVLVAANGNPSYHRAFGYKDFRTKTVMEKEAIFEWASVSKQFTAVLIMMLYENGLLEYDEPLEKYIPGLPYPGITIRQLLNHTSGLPDYQAVMDAHWDKSKVADNDDNIEYLIRFHPERNFAPGDKYEYSNTGYMLLASIVERVTGDDFTELAREKIFKPLSMRNADIRNAQDKAALADMAWGHIYVPERQIYVQADSFPSSNYNIWLGNREGPGRVSGTASDLLVWDQALYGGKVIKNETLADAFVAATLNSGKLSQYGFGFMLGNHPKLGRKVFHTGDNPGYRTIFIRYPESNILVVVLCNNEHRSFGDIVKAIEQAL